MASDQQHPIIQNRMIQYLFINITVSILKMSFFEKMMRINQCQTSTQLLRQEQKYNEHTDNQAENQQEYVQKAVKPKYQSSLYNSRQQQQLPEVPQEPKIQPVYLSIKPALITCLLPKKQQLLRDMLAKKRQFNMKKLTNSNIIKGVQLKQRLEESSTKFIQAIQTQSNTLNQQNIQSKEIIIPNATLAESRAPLPTTPINGVSLDKFKKKELKQSIVLDASSNSTHKPSMCFNNNAQNSSANPFERQIMMRLINLLENQRHDRKDMMAMSMSINQFSHHPHQEKEKDCPIIINNILKTPIDKLNKDLMQREMKIRMLQNNRSKQKYSFNLSNPLFTQFKEDQPLTQRSQYTTKCNEFNPTVTNPQKSKGKKISIQLSRVSIEGKEETAQKQFQSTKPNSNFTSHMRECDDECKPKKARERDFNKKNIKKQEAQVKKPKVQQKQQPKSIILTGKQNVNNPIVSETVIHKASVRLDIPLDQPNQTQGLTLAEAFKRRIGKLKTEKQKQIKKNQLTQKTDDAKSTITQIYNEYKTPKETSLFSAPLQNSQVINLVKEGKSKKASISSKNNITLREQKQNNTSSKKSRQPSRQLIDRLIGGERAKISKKQMYALTRKNYQNLPEIQAKKKQQQKIKLERQRLAKIKQLQKSTRTLRKTKAPPE